MKEQLTEMTGLSPRVIRVWFQNKRCKDKKRSIALKQMQEQQHKVSHQGHFESFYGLSGYPSGFIGKSHYEESFESPHQDHDDTYGDLEFHPHNLAVSIDYMDYI